MDSGQLVTYARLLLYEGEVVHERKKDSLFLYIKHGKRVVVCYFVKKILLCSYDLQKPNNY